MRSRRTRCIASLRSASAIWLSMARCIACASVAVAAAPSFADVSYAPGSSEFMPRITVFGQITKVDLRNFVGFARMAREDLAKLAHMEGGYLIFLDSSGGDVETAIAVGKIARTDKATVTVKSGNQCISACVFVLAGGVSRLVLGQVGIHRPYSPDDTQISANLQKDNYERLAKAIKGYLNTVNIPSDLYDLMVRIPPQKIRFLSADELQRYGLSENDPFEDAARVASNAKYYGITSEEFMRRQARGNRECSSTGDDEGLRCYSHILLTRPVNSA